MERLIGHVAETLMAHCETVIVGPRGARLDGEPLAFHGCPLSPLPRFVVSAALAARKAAARHRPELAFAGSGLTAPLARLAARQTKAPYAVYLHGLDIAVDNPVYKTLFVPAIRGADRVIANSHFTAGQAKAQGVPEARLHILHPGVELPTELPDHEAATEAFRKQYQLPTGPILFGAGRLTPRKGFADFVAHTLPAILKALPEAQFVLAGEVPRHAAKRTGNEAERIREAATTAGVADHVHFTGPLNDAGLARAWPAADVHVFPVCDNPTDPEGFGMAALEAAAWGVPSVAFATGGIPDAVAEGRSGYLVPPAHHDAFANAAIEAIKNRETLTAEARHFAESHAWPRFEARLLELLQI
jgi:phosphatidylinositol alpha-1,6-mannosyltransferase